MKHNFLPTVVPETPDKTIDVTDDIDVAIIKLMSTYKGYTSDEVYRLLESRVSDPSAIKPTLYMLNTNGWFDMPNAHEPLKPIFVLKRGKSFTDLSLGKRPTLIRKFKQPDDAVIDPAGRILLAEGIDVGIWKAMSDRKWRSAKDIIAILKEFGFDSQMVDKRLDTLVRGNRWFDRQGHAVRAYRLKTDLKCPQIPPVTTGPKLDILAPVVTAVDFVEPGKPTVTKTIEELDAELEDVIDSVRRSVAEILPGDSVHVAIWKVMSDLSEYTSGDLITLLSDYGFTQGSITAMLWRFNEHGYVTREPTGAQGGKKPHFIYRLKDMPMPDFKTAFGRVPQRAQAPAPALEALEQPITKEEPAMNAPAPMLQSTPVEPTAVTTLLETVIYLKGEEIRLTEFAQLYKELRAAGFQAGRVHKESLLKRTHTIKGITFTDQELDELVGKMSEMGLAFQKAVTIA